MESDPTALAAVAKQLQRRDPRAAGWRCIIRNPIVRRTGAAVFALYLIKGLAWLGVIVWLWR